MIKYLQKNNDITMSSRPILPDLHELLDEGAAEQAIDYLYLSRVGSRIQYSEAFLEIYASARKVWWNRRTQKIATWHLRNSLRVLEELKVFGKVPYISNVLDEPLQQQIEKIKEALKGTKEEETAIKVL